MVQFAPDMNKHVKRALPPTLPGFPGEADIRYYVKATVVRPKFYQENLRYSTDIKFLPIEPPRPPVTHEETFARRKQSFAPTAQSPSTEKKGFFRKSSVGGQSSLEPPNFQVDARLPNPPIVTCNERLPLRILVQKLGETMDQVFVDMLQIELIGYTHIRAHDLKRSESTGWILFSQSNMKMPLGDSLDPVGKEWKVPQRLWENIPLPGNVAPSFDTCNLSRTYELEVRIGLMHGSNGTTKPELIVLPLRLQVKVFSGIRPPPALLHAIRTNQPHVPTNGSASFDSPSSAHPTKSQVPSSPDPGSAAGGWSGMPAHAGTHMPQHYPPPADDDAPPPSYEDAMADDIAPVDGPRRDYEAPIPPLPERRNTTPIQDLKNKSGINRMPSERLFAQNNVQGPSLRRPTYPGPTFWTPPESPTLEEAPQESGGPSGKSTKEV